MRLPAAVVLGFMLAACGSESGKAQQSPSGRSMTDLSAGPIPSFDGRMVVGSGQSVFGMILRGDDAAHPGFMRVEMLTSQTSGQMRLGAAKIDAMSFVYELDCATMRYRLASQVNYQRNGQPVARVDLANTIIDGPMADYLQPACGRPPGEGIELGAAFSSMETFLATADPMQDPRHAGAAQPVITSALPPQRN